jgi:hypothetical protein
LPGGKGPDRHIGYLGDADWDKNWASVASSSSDEDDDDDKEDDFHKHNDQECVGVQEQPPPPPVSGEVSGQIYNGWVVHDDVDDMVNNVGYHYFEDTDCGMAYDIPPELTEEEQLAVAVLIRQEKERMVFLGTRMPWPSRWPRLHRRRSRRALHRRSHVARPGWSPGTCGLELRLRGRRPRRRS